MPVTLSEGLLEKTFAQLLDCGSGIRECVCYWSGPITVPGIVDGLLHPRHLGRYGFYEVDGDWINEAWLDLAHSGRTIRAQVHTHAGAAFHSQLDDDYPIAQLPGLLSLVIPHFAQRPASLEDSYLAYLTQSGMWEQLDPPTELVIEP